MARLLACGDGNPRREPHHQAPAIRAGRIRWLRCLELSATYRSFVDLCLGTQVNRALLQAGDNEPDGHRQLRDVLLSVARTAAITPDFKLALVPSTPPIAAVYREAQRAGHRAQYLGVRYGARAEAWLEGRVLGGPMVS